MSTSTEPKISVGCSHCGKLLKAPPSWIGKSLKCPGCGKTFTAAKSAGPSAAAMAPPSRTVQTSFIEDRKGTAEFKAMMLGLGLAVAAAALAIGVWYVVGSSLHREANWVSLIAGPMIGVAMYLGYRRSDVAMGFIAGGLALCTIIAGRYVMYHALADSLTQDMTVTELSGPRAVAFQYEFEKQSDQLKEYSEDEDPEGERALADRAKLRRKVIKEIEQMPEETARASILDVDYKQIDGYVGEILLTKAVNDTGYALDSVPSHVYTGASRAADEALQKLSPAQRKARYLEGRTREIRDELPMKLAELDIARTGKDPAGGVEPALVAEKKTLVEKMKVEDLIVQEYVVDAERWQLSLANLKDTGAAIATGVSFFSLRVLSMTLASIGMAFTFATGGKFRD